MSDYVTPARKALTLDDFEHQVAEAMLTRGRAIAHRGEVGAAHVLGPHLTLYPVQGTHPYTVGLNVKGRQVVYTTCNCPAAEGKHWCKHQVAVWYSLAFPDEMQEKAQKRATKTAKGKRTPNDTKWLNLMHGLAPGQLEEIVLRAVKKGKAFKTFFEAEFSAAQLQGNNASFGIDNWVEAEATRLQRLKRLNAERLAPLQARLYPELLAGLQTATTPASVVQYIKWCLNSYSHLAKLKMTEEYDDYYDSYSSTDNHAVTAVEVTLGLLLRASVGAGHETDVAKTLLDYAQTVKGTDLVIKLFSQSNGLIFSAETAPLLSKFAEKNINKIRPSNVLYGHLPTKALTENEWQNLTSPAARIGKKITAATLLLTTLKAADAVKYINTQIENILPAPWPPGQPMPLPGTPPEVFYKNKPGRMLILLLLYQQKDELAGWLAFALAEPRFKLSKETQLHYRRVLCWLGFTFKDLDAYKAAVPPKVWQQERAAILAIWNAREGRERQNNWPLHFLAHEKNWDEFVAEAQKLTGIHELIISHAKKLMAAGHSVFVVSGITANVWHLQEIYNDYPTAATDTVQAINALNNLGFASEAQKLAKTITEKYTRRTKQALALAPLLAQGKALPASKTALATRGRKPKS